jgi:muconolactone delta-isomerase
MKAKAAAPTADREEKVAAVVYRINTLLHTMRAIERHEDQLCIIMTELRNTGAITAPLDEELRDLLEQMPTHEYMEDIDAVRNTLSPEILSLSPETASTSRPGTQARSRKAAKKKA